MEHIAEFDQFIAEEIDDIASFSTFLKYEVEVFTQFINDRRWDKQIKILDYVGKSQLLATGLSLYGYKVYSAGYNQDWDKPMKALFQMGQTLKPYSTDSIETFDVIILAHNAISEYLTEHDLQHALRQVFDLLDENGVLLITTRFYDHLIRLKPENNHPETFSIEDKRCIHFSLWDWLSKEDCTYLQRHYIIQQIGERTITHTSKMHRRAWRRAEINMALCNAGFTSIDYHTLDDQRMLVGAMPQKSS